MTAVEPGSPASAGERGRGGDQGTRADEQWYLLDRRDFLVRSLADAEAEHEAGDLSDDDYALLRQRDQVRLDEVQERLAELGALEATGSPGPTGGGATATAPDGATGRLPGGGSGPSPVRTRHRRPWLAVFGLVAIAAGLVLLVVQLTAPRLLGETADGTIQLNPAETMRRQLAQAEALVNKGSLRQALAVYLQVLSKDPLQPVALAEAGYLEWELGGNDGLKQEGRSLVEKAISVQPDNYAAHLFLGIIDLVQDGNAGAAADQFTLFLAEGPPPALVQQAAATIRTAYTRAGRPVPAQVAAGG